MRRALEEDPEKDVELVAIDVDAIERPSPSREAREMREELGGKFRIAGADERVLRLYGKVMGRSQIPGTPTFVIVDREGFVFSYRGGILSPEEMMASLEFLYGVDQYLPDRWEKDRKE
ncbi:MAG: hypothetical protein HY720_05845 [Planctomycetes bacterium]|nr:hypothetical protein [Planctomycetota bacterium]